MGSRRHTEKQSFSYVIASILIHTAIVASVIYFNKDHLFSTLAKSSSYTEINFEAATPQYSQQPPVSIKKIKPKKRVIPKKVTRKKVVLKKTIKRKPTKVKKPILAAKLPPKKSASKKVATTSKTAPVAVAVAPQSKTAPQTTPDPTSESTPIAEPVDVEDEVESASEEFADPYDEVSDTEDPSFENEDEELPATVVDADNIQAARPIRPRGAPTGKDNTTSGITSSKGPLRDYRQLRQRPGNAPPIYPSYARQTGAEGTVVLTYDVSSKGNVKNIRISQSSGNRYLDTEAVRAIRRFRYFPGQEGRTVHPVNFRLRGQAKFKSPLRSS